MKYNWYHIVNMSYSEFLFVRFVQVGHPVIITVNDWVGRVFLRRTNVAAEGVHHVDQIIIDK